MSWLKAAPTEKAHPGAFFLLAASKFCHFGGLGMRKKSVEQVLKEVERAAEEALQGADDVQFSAEDISEIADMVQAQEGEDEEETAPEATVHTDENGLPSSASSSTLYLAEIRNIKPLQPKEYQALEKAIRDARLATEQLSEYRNELDDNSIKELEVLEAEGKAARKTLVEKNLWFVIYMIKPFIGQGVPFMDLIQEGNLALLEASENFDPEKGKFATYAGRIIRSTTIRVVREAQWGPITHPGCLMAEQAKIQKNAKYLEARGQDSPTKQQISEHSGVPEARIDAVETAWNNSRMVSMATPVTERMHAARGDSIVVELEEILPGETDEALLDKLHDRASKKKLLQLMQDCLTPLEELCIVLTYGFEDGIPRGCKEIGDEIGYAKSGITAICQRAEDKLRNATKRCNLRALFFAE